MKSLQNKVYDILNNLNDNNYLIDKYHKNQFTQTNTTLEKLYGLPKIHKENCPLRPILSTVNCPTNFLSNVLLSDLKKGVKLPISHLSNSFELVNKIKDIVIPDDYILLSLDVSSLFKNIPCELVLNSLDKRSSSIQKNCFMIFFCKDNCLDYSLDVCIIF